MQVLNRVDDISTRTERQTRWLASLREKAIKLRQDFARAVRSGNPVDVERASESYVNKCRFIAHVELTILQNSLEKARLVKSLTTRF